MTVSKQHLNLIEPLKVVLHAENSTTQLQVPEPEMGRPFGKIAKVFGVNEALCASDHGPA